MPSADTAPSTSSFDMDERATKAALRSDILKRRTAMAEAAAHAHVAVMGRILGDLPVSSDDVIAGYWPIRSEVDVRPVMAALHARGHVCSLPVVMGPGLPLVFRVWSPTSSMVAAGWGIHVPPPDVPEVRPTLLLVPLLGFDRKGNRLGYGTGYYDRTLAALRAKGPTLAVGIGYAAQEVEDVPSDPHDQKLDWIVTESFAFQVSSV